MMAWRFLLEVGVMAFSLAALFLAGRWFLRTAVYRDYEDTTDPAADVIFCTVFALSCNLLELVIFEIVPVLGTK